MTDLSTAITSDGAVLLVADGVAIGTLYDPGSIDLLRSVQASRATKPVKRLPAETTFARKVLDCIRDGQQTSTDIRRALGDCSHNAVSPVLRYFDVRDLISCVATVDGADGRRSLRVYEITPLGEALYAAEASA